MNTIQDALTTVLPPRRKSPPSGWISFNAPCCQNRGERADRRQRGGVLLIDQGFQYHCFNCGFKAGWSTGKLLSKNSQSLFRWLGMTDTQIKELGLAALKQKDTVTEKLQDLDLTLEIKELPEHSLALEHWAKLELSNQDEEALVAVIKYLDHRGLDIDCTLGIGVPVRGLEIDC